MGSSTKVALVTGSARGIGKAIAIGLAREGLGFAMVIARKWRVRIHESTG